MTSALLSWAPPAQNHGRNQSLVRCRPKRAGTLDFPRAVRRDLDELPDRLICVDWIALRSGGGVRLEPASRARIQASAAGRSRRGRLVCRFSGCGLVVPSARDGQRRSRLLCDRPDRAALCQRRQAAAGAAAAAVDAALPISRTAVHANAILLSTWPIATYCFLRSFESRSLAWSAAAGAAAPPRCSGNTIRSCWSPGSSSRRSRTPGGSTICDRRRRGYRSWRVLLFWRRICTGTSRPAAKR